MFHPTLPTDSSPYLLSGSASGASFSLLATIAQIPLGQWLGAIVAFASLAGNIWIEREKNRRKAEARKESEEASQAVIRELSRVLSVLEERGRRDAPANPLSQSDARPVTVPPS